MGYVCDHSSFPYFTYKFIAKIIYSIYTQTIPSELKLLPFLTLLDLAMNVLTGPIPQDVGEMKALGNNSNEIPFFIDVA